MSLLEYTSKDVQPQPLATAFHPQAPGQQSELRRLLCRVGSSCYLPFNLKNHAITTHDFACLPALSPHKHPEQRYHTTYLELLLSEPVLLVLEVLKLVDKLLAAGVLPSLSSLLTNAGNCV